VAFFPARSGVAFVNSTPKRPAGLRTHAREAFIEFMGKVHVRGELLSFFIFFRFTHAYSICAPKEKETFISGTPAILGSKKNPCLFGRAATQSVTEY